MKISAWLLGIAAVLVSIYVLSASPGKKELQKQIEAIDHVQSWKMELDISSNGRMLAWRTHEAQCPDMEHITERGMQSSGEFIRLANDVYYRRDGGAWLQDANTPTDLFMPFVTPRPCMSNPGGSKSAPDSGDTEWKSELKRAIKDGSFEKGELDTVRGESCRNWQVSWMNARGQMVAYTMCINEQDHLPRRMQMARENINMYFKWNVPVDIQPPDMSPPPPVTPAYPVQPADDSDE